MILYQNRWFISHMRTQINNTTVNRSSQLSAHWLRLSDYTTTFIVFNFFKHTTTPHNMISCFDDILSSFVTCRGRLLISRRKKYYRFVLLGRNKIKKLGIHWNIAEFCMRILENQQNLGPYFRRHCCFKRCLMIAASCGERFLNWL